MSRFRGYQSWDYGTMAAPPESGPADHALILKDPKTHAVVEPTQQGVGLTVVLLPAVDLNLPPEQPARLLVDGATGKPFDRFSAEPRKFTNFLYPFKGVRMAGAPGRKFTVFFQNDPDAPDARYTHPYVLLKEACWNAKRVHDKQGGEIVVGALGSSRSENWPGLLFDEKDPPPGQPQPGGPLMSQQPAKPRAFKMIPKPSTLVAAFAVVCARGAPNGKDRFYIREQGPLGMADNDPMPVLLLSGATAESLAGQLDELREGRRCDPQDLTCLKWGRVTSSLFVHVYDKESMNCPAMIAYNAERYNQVQVGPGQGWGGGGRRVTGGQQAFATGAQAGGGFGYNVFLSETFEGTTNGTRVPTEACDSLAARRLTHPETVFKEYGNDDLARLISAAGFPPGLVYHAFQDHREWIPSDLQHRYVARVVASVPAAPPAAGPGPTPTWGGQPAPHASTPLPVTRDPVPPAQPGGMVSPSPTGSGGWVSHPVAPPPVSGPAPGGGWGIPPAGPAPVADPGVVIAAPASGAIDPALQQKAEAALQKALEANPALAAGIIRNQAAGPIPPGPAGAGGPPW